jgi:hypothetical protein
MPKASMRVVDEGWRHNRLNKSTIGQGRLLPGMLFLALAGQLLKTLCLDPARRREPFLAGLRGRECGVSEVASEPEHQLADGPDTRRA